MVSIQEERDAFRDAIPECVSFCSSLSLQTGFAGFHSCGGFLSSPPLSEFFSGASLRNLRIRETNRLSASFGLDSRGLKKRGEPLSSCVACFCRFTGSQIAKRSSRTGNRPFACILRICLTGFPCKNSLTKDESSHKISI